MDNKDKLQELKHNYNDIEIPDRLDEVVNAALQNNKSNNNLNKYKKIKYIAASILIFVISVNISPTFANALEKVPVLGHIVKVVRLSNYSVNENGFDISIDVPKIVGLENKELEDKLNEELEAEAKRIYNEYLNEMEELKKENVEGHSLVKSWYEIKTDNEDVLSLIVYYHYAQGSSYTERKCYNIDKKNQEGITLNSLFKGKDYVKIISDNIKEQMVEQMKKDPDKVYWINSEIPEMDFKEISKEQQFYLNENNEVVICFDKYEVAPGYMGTIEFVIPNDIFN